MAGILVYRNLDEPRYAELALSNGERVRIDIDAAGATISTLGSDTGQQLLFAGSPDLVAQVALAILPPGQAPKTDLLDLLIALVLPIPSAEAVKAAFDETGKILKRAEPATRAAPVIGPPNYAGKSQAIATLVVAEFLAMAVWFAAAAALPALRREVALDPLFEALLTSAVQGGFVVGTVTSALLSLPDRLSPRRLFSISALIAGLASLFSLGIAPDSGMMIALRLITGIALAGVYPVGLKIAASWARADTGLLMGLLVGALTIGSASPHLLGLLDGRDWRTIYLLAGLAALVSALGIWFVRIGPNMGKAPPLDFRHALRAWTDRPLRLANLGYLGHMWELYAMWAWIGLFLQASFTLRMTAVQIQFWAPVATFATIAIGAIGCFLAGYAADRVGRTATTSIAMAVSGLCSILVGLAFGGHPALVMVICLIWGLSIVADSAQFSASVAELADRSLVGTMLTIQTAQGFLLTLVTIHLVPYAVDFLGWSWAFAILAVGPFVGTWAMLTLRRDPAASKLAAGHR